MQRWGIGAVAAAAVVLGAGATDAGARSLPVYKVTARGVGTPQAKRLASGLGLDRTFRTGLRSIRMVDPARFKVVPTKPLNAAAGVDEDGRPTYTEAFDPAAINRL